MADYKVTDTELTSIANAIRAKTGKSAQIEFPTEFVSEIGSISGGGVVIQSLSVTQNGTYTPPSGVDGYSPVTVNVSGGSTGKLSIIDPDMLDVINATTNKSASFPVVASLAKYSSADHFALKTSSFDGSNKPCVGKTGNHIASMLYPQMIPAGKYSKLYAKLKADKGGSGTNYRCYIALHQTNGFTNADGWISDNNVKMAYIIDMEKTVSDINSQDGVTINISEQTSCPEQVVEVDIPQDASFYVGVVAWFTDLYIRELYLQ